MEEIKVASIHLDIDKELANAQEFPTAISPEIKSNTDYELVASGVQEAQARIKALDNDRLELTRPLDAVKKSLIAKYAPVKQPYEDFIKAGKAEMVRWNKVIQEEQRKQAERLEALKAEGKDVDLPAQTVEAPKVSGVSLRENWSFRIVDENLIPREYLKPDEKLLGEVARSMKGKIKVPGVEFFSETGISSKRSW